MSKSVSITSIPGLRVGHWTDREAATGCTVVLCPEGAVASVDVRGGAPGTRETDLLRAGTLVQRVHAVLLSGGSAYGLDAATGVMRWLEERGHGFPVVGVVPIVPAAILIDLSLGNPKVRPTADAGYAACEAARQSIGRGMCRRRDRCDGGEGAGLESALKGGIGSAVEMTESGVAVAALIAVNSFGEVVDPESGRVVAGPRGRRPGRSRRRWRR